MTARFSNAAPFFLDNNETFLFCIIIVGIEKMLNIMCQKLIKLNPKNLKK